MALLNGVYADELEEISPAFVDTVSRLLRSGARYEAVLCGMSMVLAQLAADVPPDGPKEEDREYLNDAMGAIFQAVKDIVAARETNAAP